MQSDLKAENLLQLQLGAAVPEFRFRYRILIHSARIFVLGVLGPDEREKLRAAVKEYAPSGSSVIFVD